MLFRILLLFFAFLFPFMVTFGYLYLCEKMQKKSPEKKKLLAGAFLSGVCLVALLLVYFRLISGTSDIEGKIFVPATLDKDGNIIPSHYK